MATSLVLVCIPKFPVTVSGASGLRYSARTLPARSTTAMTAVVGEVAAAAARTIVSTSVAVKVIVADAEEGVGLLTADCGVLWLPAPQPTRKIDSTTTRITAAAMLSISTFRRRSWARRAGTGSLNVCIGLGGCSIQSSFYAVFNEFGGQCNQVMKARSIVQVYRSGLSLRPIAVMRLLEVPDGL